MKGENKMALTGFDPAIVQTSMNNFIAAANDTMDVLCNKFQAQFVNKMAELWACSNAQAYFRDSVKPALDSLTNDANTVFTSVVNSMKTAGQNWASQTGATFSAPTYTSNRKPLDVSMIKENIGGVRGIDLSAASTVSSNMAIINGAAEGALSRAVAAVQNCGFIGGESAANLLASLNQIKRNINTTFTTCNAQLKTAISTTVTNYKNTEGKIAQAFAGN